MNITNKNLIANYAGKIWAAVINIAFIPLYIKYIGIEAYGLVGAFATIQPLMTILDMGMSASINRELARYSALPGQAQNMRDLVRTLEIIYWCVAIIVCIFIFLLSPLIARHWFKANELPPKLINQAVVLMGLAIVFQWPVGFYSGGLIGLQKQVLFNVFNSILWTLRCFGALIAVILSSNPVISFFKWQLIMSVVSVLSIGLLLWRTLPLSYHPAKFKKEILYSVWQFSIGFGTISIILLIFNQLDKIFISNLISLDMFGYYSIVWQIVGCLFLFYYPIYVAYFPAITQLLAQKELENVKKTYHKGYQFMSVALFPVSAVLAIFSREILFIWTSNTIIADNCHLLLSIILIGASFNGLFYMPYSINQAYGNTKHLLFIFIPFLISYIPLIYCTSKTFGVFGAAITFTVVSVIQQLIVGYVTHWLYLPNENIKWFLNDIFRPLFTSLIVVIFAKIAIFWNISGIFGLITILTVYFISLITAVTATPYTKLIASRIFCIR